VAFFHLSEASATGEHRYGSKQYLPRRPLYPHRIKLRPKLRRLFPRPVWPRNPPEGYGGSGLPRNAPAHTLIMRIERPLGPNEWHPDSASRNPKDVSHGLAE
jgi:hypothetical protein